MKSPPVSSPVPAERSGVDPTTEPSDRAANQSKTRDRWIQAGQILLLAALVFAAYWPALLAGYVWDDDAYILRNTLLHTVSGLRHIWFNITAQPHEPQYYPLTHTTFWIEYHLWQLSPRGYHLDNLLLHMISALVLWRLLKYLKMPGAYLAALLWAVHPIQVESVAWATERKNVLSGLLYLLSLCCYLATPWGRSFWKPVSPSPGTPGEGAGKGQPPNDSRAVEPGSPPRAFSSFFPFYILSLLLFIGALLSKSVTATLPAVLLLLAWWKRGRITWRDIPPLLPFFLAGIAMGSLTGWLEKHQVGALGPDFDWLTPLDRVAIAGRAIWFYFSKLLLPLRLAFIYPRWSIDPGARPWQLLFAIAVLFTLGALWRLRPRVGQGPLVAALFFCGSLVPALGFTNVFPMRYSFVADHFQYLAGIGPIALIAALLSHRRLRHIGQGVLVLLILGCCVAANRQTRIYQSLQTLWTDTLAKNPNSAMAHLNEGHVLQDAGDLDGAEREYRRAMELQPNDPSIRTNIGSIFAARGDFRQAISWYQQAIDQAGPLMGLVPRIERAQAEFQMGEAYMGWSDHLDAGAVQRQYHQAAVLAYRRAIDDYPDFALAMIRLGMNASRENRLEEAADFYRRALGINPESFEAHTNLGNIYQRRQDYDHAVEEYRRALAIFPDDAVALNNLGTAYARLRMWDEAIPLFQASIQANPNFALARRNLMAAVAAKTDNATLRP